MKKIKNNIVLAAFPVLVALGLFGAVVALAVTSIESVLLSQTGLGAASYTSNANLTATFSQTIDCSAVNGTVTSIDIYLGSGGATFDTLVEFDGVYFGLIRVVNTGDRMYTLTGGSVACTSGVKTLLITDNSTNGIYVFGSIANTYTGGIASCTNCSQSNGGIEDIYFALHGILGSTSVPSPVVALPATGGSELVDSGTINVVNIVVNDNGGTKTVADFPLFVNGMSVVSGKTNTFYAPAPAYTITETSDANYTKVFSGDCDVDGRISLNPGQNKFCTITNNDIATPTTAAPLPQKIEVVNTPWPRTLSSSPGLVEYTYLLRNTGTLPVTNISISDDICSSISLVSLDTTGNVKLDANKTWTYRCSTTLFETSTNTVTVTGMAGGVPAVARADATVVVMTPPVANPIIHTTKVPNPTKLGFGGGFVTFTNIVKNLGTVSLSNIRLTDDKCINVKYISGDKNGDNKLNTTETWVFTCTINLTDTTTSTVYAEGDADGLTAQDSEVVTVEVASEVPGLPDTGITSALSTQILTIDVDLWNGSRGINVTILQQFLIAQNKGPGARALASVGATGYFGDMTQRALAEFQADVGISPPFGYFGPITRAYISAHY